MFYKPLLSKNIEFIALYIYYKTLTSFISLLQKKTRRQRRQPEKVHFLRVKNNYGNLNSNNLIVLEIILHVFQQSYLLNDISKLFFIFQFLTLEGLNSGVPTRTTPTLTPTTLSNIEQTFIEYQTKTESHENEARFVPPLVHSIGKFFLYLLMY